MTKRSAMTEAAGRRRAQGRRTLLSRLAALAAALAPLALLPAGRAAAKEIAQPRNPGPPAFMNRNSNSRDSILI